jgi:hypothetical protein
MEQFNEDVAAITLAAVIHLGCCYSPWLLLEDNLKLSIVLANCFNRPDLYAILIKYSHK